MNLLIVLSTAAGRIPTTVPTRRSNGASQVRSNGVRHDSGPHQRRHGPTLNLAHRSVNVPSWGAFALPSTTVVKAVIASVPADQTLGCTEQP